MESAPEVSLSIPTTFMSLILSVIPCTWTIQLSIKMSVQVLTRASSLDLRLFLQIFFDDATGKTFVATADIITDPEVLAKKTGFPVACTVREVDVETGRNLTLEQSICYTSVGNGVAEGPHIFRKGKYYYLSVAIGGTEILHQQWIHRSETGPYGPWQTASSDINPMIFNGDHSEIRLTGHMDLCEGPDGRWWAVYLAVRPQLDENGEVTKMQSQLGRETFLSPVEWVDDWPVVNHRQKATINMPVSAGLPRLDETFEQIFDFAPGRRE